MKSYGVTIELKPLKQYFLMVLFVLISLKNEI